MLSGQPQIIFKENKGQWPDKVLFGADISGLNFFVNKSGFNYCVYNNQDLQREHKHRPSPASFSQEEIEKTVAAEEHTMRGHNYEVDFQGADFSKPVTLQEQSVYFNYFLGNDKSRWASHVKGFGKILFNEIYSGIGLSLYSAGTGLKYDLIIKPSVNTNIIKLNYNFADKIEIRNNELVIKTSIGEIFEKSPVAYQIIKGRRVDVKCNYNLAGENSVGFEFPEGYDTNYELVIDPVIVVCSYSGASNDCDNYCATYDAKGNIYDAGISSPGYPVNTGAFQMTCKDKFRDIIISKYDSIGASKYFSTYIGGDSLDFPLEILVKNNEITVMGLTLSKNYPVSATGYDTTYNGNYDIVVSKLNMSGTALLASTFIGGNANEGFNIFSIYGWDYYSGEFVCDTSGNVYVISATNSANFPITTGAVSPIKKGTNDAIVFKLNKTLSGLNFSTFLGGAISESGKAIRLDGAGGVFCFGTTNSLNFPTKPGCISSTRSGSSDFYITHLNSTATSIIASTFLGTAAADYASLMDVDQNNNIYLCGTFTNPPSLVPSPGIYNNANGYNSIYKINSGLSNIIYQTKFGYYNTPLNQYLNYTAFKVDSCQNVYIAGFGSNSFPTTPNAFQSYGGGNSDIYVALFNTNCSSLSFASFFGGSGNTDNIGEHVDAGTSHFDGKGYLYQAICSSGGLPTTPGAYAPNFVNTTTLATIYNDAILKLDFRTFVNAGSSYGPDFMACPPYTGTFVSTTNTGTSIWNFGDGTSPDTATTATHLYNNYGVYNVVLTVTDTSTCNKTDSIKTKLSVIPPTPFDLGPDKKICINSTLVLKSNISAVSYTWSTGENTPDITIHYPGLYQLTINNGGCESSALVNVKVDEMPFETLFPNIITPNNDGVNEKIDFTKYNLSEMEFFVYDRWGKERFKTTDTNAYWDTRDYDEGTYFYVINYKSTCTGKSNTGKGYISVFK